MGDSSEIYRGVILAISEAIQACFFLFWVYNVCGQRFLGHNFGDFGFKLHLGALFLQQLGEFIADGVELGADGILASNLDDLSFVINERHCLHKMGVTRQCSSNLRDLVH